MKLDTSGWSGEGTFTARLVDFLKTVDGVDFVRVEDAPASRSDADYNFISNEVYVAFATRPRVERIRRFGVIPATRTSQEKSMSIAELEAVLAQAGDIGPPDYSDAGMLQYLKTERIIPPYQTRGYKLVEMIRVYEAAPPARH